MTEPNRGRSKGWGRRAVADILGRSNSPTNTSEIRALPLYKAANNSKDKFIRWPASPGRFSREESAVGRVNYLIERNTAIFCTFPAGKSQGNQALLPKASTSAHPGGFFLSSGVCAAWLRSSLAGYALVWTLGIILPINRGCDVVPLVLLFPLGLYILKLTFLLSQ